MSDDSTPLDGRRALVTGASAGIGRETARALARDGADVAVAARRRERLEDLAVELTDEYGATAVPVQADVAEPAQVTAMVETAADALGGLDLVVANAAIGTSNDLAVHELPADQYRQVMAVNCDGTFFTARETLPHLLETAGTLVFVGSFAGKFPRPGGPVYAATKFWTRGFALSLSAAYGDRGVAVSVVNPSEVRTEFGKEYRTETNAERLPPGEVSEPEDVAAAVAYAASEEAPNTVQELDLFRRDKFSGL
ncbi:MAG: SDR family oxidoreductase [Halobacteriaceae archaeon]